MCAVVLLLQAVAAREDRWANIQLFHFDIEALYAVSIGGWWGRSTPPVATLVHHCAACPHHIPASHMALEPSWWQQQ